MAIKVVTDQNIGNGLFIAGGKLHADPSYGPSTLALSNPSGPNLQVTVNGATSTLDLTPLIQAGETNTTLTYDPATKTLTYTNEDAVVFTVDLSALASDIFVQGGSYDPTTMVLTLTDNDGVTPDITINLAELKKVATANSNGITWSGTGEDSNPLIASIVVDPASDNLATISPAGIKVTINQNVGISGDGTAASPLEFAADELPSPAIDTQEPANNFVMSTPNRPAGQLVPILDAAEAVWIGSIESQVNNLIPTMVIAMMTVDVQDLAGTHLFYAL